MSYNPVTGTPQIVSLEQEWHNGLTALRIVLKILLIGLVLAYSPHCHLIEASKCKEQSCTQDTEQFKLVNYLL